MMLTQQMSVLAHDLAAHCRVAGLSQAEDRKKTAGIRKPPSHHTLMEDCENQMDFAEERRLSEHYSQGDSIGNGGFGSVYAGTCKRTGKSVAIKSIYKRKVYGWSMIGNKMVPKEVALLHTLEQKYIIKMLDYFEEKDKFYIVMERPEKYIDLFDYITQKGTVSERSSRYLFRQVLEAVQYCLSKGVLHRDVKDENILIDLNSNQVKLIDFGSGTFLQDEVYTEYEGTNVYCPPEWVLHHRYHAVPATIWSLGILLYDMLLGDVPFEKDSEIADAQLHFHVNISKDAESLIRWMLSFHPHQRPTMDQVFNHPWMKSPSTSSSPSSSSSYSSSPTTSAHGSVSSLSSSDSYGYSSYQSQSHCSPVALKYPFRSTTPSPRNHVPKSSNHHPVSLQSSSPRPATVGSVGRGGGGFTTSSYSPFTSPSYTSSMQTRSQSRLNGEKTSLASSSSGYNQMRGYSPVFNGVGCGLNRKSPSQYFSSSKSSSCRNVCRSPTGNSDTSFSGSQTSVLPGVQLKTRKNPSVQHPKSK